MKEEEKFHNTVHLIMIMLTSALIFACGFAIGFAYSIPPTGG